MTQCPDTKVIMAGYSQGGQLVHNAAKMLPASTSSKVAAAVIFGDPSMFAFSLSPIESLKQA
jgi:cutinase